MTVRGVCGHIKASWDNHSNCLSCSSCSRLSTCSVCKTWTAGILQTGTDYIVQEDLPGQGKDWLRKTVVQSDLTDDNSTRDWFCLFLLNL